MGGRDYPDWGGYPTEAGEQPLKDLGELATRLGAPMWRGRSGAVMLIEDFSLGSGRWDLGSDAGVSDPVISDTVWRYGGYALKVDPSSTNTKQAWATIKMTGYPATKCGLAIAFSLYALDVKIKVAVTQYAAPYKYHFGFKLEPDAADIQLKNSAGSYVDAFETGALVSDWHLFHNLKLVWDIDNEVYHRLVFDGQEEDTFLQTPHIEASTEQDYFTVLFEVTSGGTASSAAYLDHAVFTYNEF